MTFVTPHSMRATSSSLSATPIPPDSIVIDGLPRVEPVFEQYRLAPGSAGSDLSITMFGMPKACTICLAASSTLRFPIGSQYEKGRNDSLPSPQCMSMT